MILKRNVTKTWTCIYESTLLDERGLFEKGTHWFQPYNILWGKAMETVKNMRVMVNTEVWEIKRFITEK